MRANIFLARKDLYLNFDKELSNMIIVTGMSGSGKSHLSKTLQKTYSDYEIVSFDRLFGFEESREMNKLEKILISKFKKKNSNTAIENDEQICDKFYDFVCDYIDNNNLKIIFDGAYFLDKVNFDKIKNKQIILKRTPIVVSIIRRTKRNFIYILNHKYSFIRTLKEIYWLNSYNIKHLKIWLSNLNHFYQNIDKLNKDTKIRRTV